MEKRILDLINRNCIQKKYEDNSILKISEALKIGRNQCSLLLKQLMDDKKVVRIDSKPFIYVSTSFLDDQKIPYTKDRYANLDELFLCEQESDFEELVGYQHSLKETVNQCKATIAYPPNGLPMLLYGPTGTGKSFIAKLSYKWAVHQGIVKGKFVTVNCSEYANNPELLTANLFGHVKGAFTGADKDNEGLISLANDGVLFLDEVHELKAECQEKLFLFMDQGIYHRVGDNEKWYKSNVRIIFATTENPEKVLLKTLLRRIPMVITIPSLDERGTQERIELLYTLFSNEQARLNCKIKLSSKVYSVLLSSKMPGNIGELKSCIQTCCINSLFTKENGELIIRLNSLPKKLLNMVYSSQKSSLTNDEYIYVDDLKGIYHHEKEIIQLSDELIYWFNELKNNKISLDEMMSEGKKTVERYFDNLVLRKHITPQIEYYKRGVQYVFDLVANRYGVKITNNDILAISCYLDELANDYHEVRTYSLQHEEDCEDLSQLLENEFFRAANISLEICTYLKSYLELEINPIVICTFIFYIYNHQKDTRYNQKASVVMAHGFSTASSIADAANRLLGEYVFDAIDMPLYVDTATMIEKLNLYLSRIGKIKELYLLVDMGSLEEIYKGIKDDQIDIGIINNVSTAIALEIGNGIRQNTPMEQLFKDTIEGTQTNFMYHIVQNKLKKPVILCSCASGIGTARKLQDMIESSLPQDVSIDVKICNYNELIEYGTTSALFEQNNVLCVIGTLNPNVEGIHFIGIEDLIINDSFDELNEYFNDYMSLSQIEEFNRRILHNFSLSNIMNALTILNPHTLLKQVTNSLDQLQEYLNKQFSSKTCFGLYVHICCMIERLVLSKESEQVDSSFENEHPIFVSYIKKSFKNIELYYGIDIPIQEIAYIYKYIENDY
ncbi:sigma 54-interacting transcriptional regulator [Floccifex sp.]|uniref:sigma 54-interacting transcriptional regulator n=1 Tax=Floccifex sp. TaxID=2815810 RepID=UPI002A74D68B|nr:sigma 54-interacting transcriptional regulator [Floccifex sp.]MDD7280438.1 sigma 54-interacting transcriptional regulator [Erysipelotrichaceae bacterium]MDY2957460.1 sigma 54-interacting transcriptional regulator [Floccifex sp.]